MAPHSSYPELEINTSQPLVVSFEEAPEIEPFIGGTEPFDSYKRSEMADPSGKKSHSFGSSWKNPENEWSSKYSHEETRPEKLQERIQDLHHDMQDSLQRLQNLEVKLKNGARKKRRKSTKTDIRKNAELQKALYEMMKDTEPASK